MNRQKIILLIVTIGMLFFIGVFFTQNKVNAQGDCSEYGFMATYDYLSGGCKCMSGYVFGKDFLGKTTCVSADGVCRDKYGIMSRYDILSESCACSYGYVLGNDIIGRTQCISEDEACQNQFGSHARSTYGGQCKCAYGYGFRKNSRGETQCIDLDSICQDKYGFDGEYDTSSEACSCRYGYELSRVSYGSGLECKSCTSKYGIHSSYDAIDKKCGCDSGYTLNDANQCVEKENNVYFTVIELDTDERRAIIKSDYDYNYYLISYGIGCYASSFNRYLNHQIVVNLGTDFDLDTWDKIVLKDDDEVCDITSVEKANSSTTLHPEEEKTPINLQTPIINTPQPSSVPDKPLNQKPTFLQNVVPPKEQVTPITNKQELKRVISNKATTTLQSTSSSAVVEPSQQQPRSFWKRVVSPLNSMINFFRKLKFW